ncbi:HTH-type transcriptional regulator DegA [Peptococcaceae bacterium CEB3]|nr:HTH-type transcriptional regulator DegA [Peptococcaceae bacterium CEB3]
MTATIKDIAARTGLSITTVSLVLNNKQSRISPKTRQLIFDTARELNYIPNQMAVSLVTKETKTLGLVIMDIANPFFAELSKGISAKASAYAFDIILCDTGDSYEQTMRSLKLLASKNVDGVVMTLSDEIRDEKMKVLSDFLQNHTLPVVLIERVDRLVMADCLNVNHEKGSRLAADHLLKLGHRKVGCITGPSHLEATGRRLKGLKDVFAENGVEFRPELVVEGDYHIESGYAGTERILTADPSVTAIYAFNDLMAYGVYQCLKDRGIGIPDQMSVVGFDDIFFSKMLYAPLTSVALPIRQMGERAVQLLIERVANRELPRRCDVLEPSLIVRESTAAPRGTGPLD